MVEEDIHSGFSLKAVLSIVGLLLLAFVVQGIFRAGNPPEIKIDPGMPAIGKRTPVKVEVLESRRGLTSVRVELIQGDKSATLADRSYRASSQFAFGGSKTDRDVLLVEAGRQSLPSLTSGSATIRVTAGRAGTWLRHPDAEIQEVSLPVRLTPPSIQITSTQTYVVQGGSEVVVYRVGESAVRDGVRSGAWWFPGYPLPGGGKQDRFAFFAVPYDMAKPDVKLAAEDAAGNEAEMGFIDKFFPKPPKLDNVEVTDAFIAKVVPQILSQSPELKDSGNPLDNYLAINRELRQKNNDTLKLLAQRSKPEFLWDPAVRYDAERQSDGRLCRPENLFLSGKGYRSSGSSRI